MTHVIIPITTCIHFSELECPEGSDVQPGPPRVLQGATSESHKQEGAWQETNGHQAVEGLRENEVGRGKENGSGAIAP